MPDAKLPACKLCGAEPLVMVAGALGSSVCCSRKCCPAWWGATTAADWTRLHGTTALAPEHVEALREFVRDAPRYESSTVVAIRAALAALDVEVRP